MTEKRLFNPNLYECRNCNDVIYSSYPGEFVTCKCWQQVVNEREKAFYNEAVEGEHYEVNTYEVGNPLNGEVLYEATYNSRTEAGEELYSQICKQFPNQGIAVDETEYYTRQAGQAFNFIPRGLKYVAENEEDET